MNRKIWRCIPPQLHAAVAQAAELNGKSINQWIVDKLGKAVHSH
ncbi:MAG: toxin-antitoxin system HicB family antitoxin [Deltaproteobacteria bacterium]|nr:toxin-antitoxin system HicB family antitoxin [Deltaproteobacteria bacterium]